MASKTITLTSTPTLLARGAGHRGSERNISVLVKGAVDIVVGDATSQDFTVATTTEQDFAKVVGDDLWGKSTGADTEVELEFDIKTLSDVEEVLRSGAPAGQHKARWYSTRNPANTSQAIYEKYKPGSGSLQMGSTTGADTNDPLRLTHSGGQHYVYFPGTANNGISVPDSLALSITGDIDIRYELASSDYAPTDTSTILAKRGAAGQVSWQLRLNAGSSGKPQFLWSEDGTATSTALSTVPIGFADGDKGWIRVTVDVDDGASDSEIVFYTSTDGDTWTQLGSVINPGSTTSIFDSTADVTAGLYLTSQFPYDHSLYRAQIYDGIDGTLVLDINPAADIDTQDGAAPDAGQSSFTCTTGQTVTVNRGSSGATTTVVTDPVDVPDGTDDYEQSSDLPTFTRTSGKLSVGMLLRKWVASAAFERALSFESAVNDGLHLGWNSSDKVAVYCGDGATVSAVHSGGYTLGELILIGFTVSDGQLYLYQEGEGLTAATALSTLSSDPTFAAGRLFSRAYSVGNLPDGVEYRDHVYAEGAAFNEADWDVLAAHLKTGDF